MAPKYILYYFDLTGRGEGIRYLLHYKKVDFEDRRIPFDQWPAMKSQMPAGQMPVLEVGGKKLSQSAAIARYLGNEHGLTASTAWDNAKLDEAVDAANVSFTFSHAEMMSDPNLRRWFHEQDEKKKESIRNEIIQQGLPPKFDNLLRVSGLSETHPFLNGNKPTWADFYVAGLLTFLNQAIFKGQLATTNKGLSDYLNRVKQLEGVKEYIAQHPQTPMA